MAKGRIGCLIVELTLRAGCMPCLNGLCFRQVRALHQRSTQESERYSFSIDVLAGNRSVASDQRVRKTRKNIKAVDE